MLGWDRSYKAKSLSNIERLFDASSGSFSSFWSLSTCSVKVSVSESEGMLDSKAKFSLSNCS